MFKYGCVLLHSYYLLLTKNDAIYSAAPNCAMFKYIARHTLFYLGKAKRADVNYMVHIGTTDIVICL